MSAEVERPGLCFGKEYEMDELRTYVAHKSRLIWIAYALRRDTREVVDFQVGKRNNKTLARVIRTLTLSGSKKIYTDKLRNYKYLID